MTLETANKLSKILENAPSTIELLPGDAADWLTTQVDKTHRPFLFTDGHLGVPEKDLYQCYMYCARVFQSSYCNHLDHGKVGVAEADKMIMLTSIILLANPGHMTSLNLRKSLLSSGYIDPLRELKYAAALLTIKQSSKVSMLWHHRRWILSLVYSGNEVNALDEHFPNTPLSCDTLRAEFSLSLAACEVYPRNYHAWYHRYLCLQACVSQGKISASDDHTSLLYEEREIMWQWLRLHISDHSAISYMTRVFEGLSLLGGGLRIAELLGEEEERVIDLIRTYPSHESLWLYLRYVISSQARTKLSKEPVSQDLAEEIIQTHLQGGKGTATERDKSHKTIRLALRHQLWLRSRNHPMELDPEELKRVLTGPIDESIRTKSI